MPRGKKRAEPDEPETEQAQKFRSVCKAVDDSAAEFLCPITQELPIDPVMAEDGHTYERSAIEKWLRDKKTSPRTNEAMGERLIPALQVKNAIATMVKSGALSGDKCEAWTKKLELEKGIADMRAKAEAGDVIAMNSLGVWYRYAFNGLAEDHSMAFYWFKRAADLDDPGGMADLAHCYYEGRGTEKDPAQAMIKLTQSATLGCCHAIFSMIIKYHHGDRVLGIKKSASDALYWAKKLESLPCTTAQKKRSRDGWLRIETVKKVLATANE